MAYTSIRFRNYQNRQVREVPVGYSWTTMLFGPFPALLRGDWRSALLIGLLAVVTLTLSNLVFAWSYNRSFAQRLLADGFVVGALTSEDLAAIERRNPELVGLA